MNDLLSAASVLLAIVGVVYALWDGEISRAEQAEIPEHVPNRVGPRREITRVLKSRALPLAVAISSIVLVFLPDTIGILVNVLRHWGESGPKSLGQYDAVRASLCVVELFAVLMAASTWLRVWRLVALRRRLAT